MRIPGTSPRTLSPFARPHHRLRTGLAATLATAVAVTATGLTATSASAVNIASQGTGAFLGRARHQQRLGQRHDR